MGKIKIFGGNLKIMEANVLVEFVNDFLIGGIFFQLGANVLVEFENVFLIGAFFPILGAIRGKCVSGI